MIFLPVLLSIIGPQAYSVNNKEEPGSECSTKSNHVDAANNPDEGSNPQNGTVDANGKSETSLFI